MYKGDGHVAGEINALLGSALSGDIILECAVEAPEAGVAGEEPDPDDATEYEQAETVRRFCECAIEGLETDLRVTLRDMARAIYLGHRVAEVVYKAGSTPTLKPATRAPRSCWTG